MATPRDVQRENHLYSRQSRGRRGHYADARKGETGTDRQSEPTLDVSYGISHHVSDVNDLDELFVSQKKAIVHFIACDSGGARSPR
jgi:hypothetical protein